MVTGRNGREQLPNKENERYQKLIVAQTETERRMKEIDKFSL